MDPPSTPPPAAMRGPHLDRALREVDSKRPALDPEMPPSIRASQNAEAAFALAERLAREALEHPVSDAPPLTMRGDDALERVLEGVRSTPRSSKLRPTTRH